MSFSELRTRVQRLVFSVFKYWFVHLKWFLAFGALIRACFKPQSDKVSVGALNDPQRGARLVLLEIKANDLIQRLVFNKAESLPGAGICGLVTLFGQSARRVLVQRLFSPRGRVF